MVKHASDIHPRDIVVRTAHQVQPDTVDILFITGEFKGRHKRKGQRKPVSDVAFAFKVPSNSKMGSSMAVYTTGTPALKSGVTGSGESFWNGYGQSNCSGGSDVTLSNYSSGGNRPGGWH